MRVAFITNMDPNGYGGGSIGCYRFLEVLKRLVLKNEIEDYLVMYLSKFKGVSAYERNSEKFGKLMGFRKTKLSRILTALAFRISPLEFYERKIMKMLEEFQPKIVIVQYSNMGFLTKRIKKRFPKAKIVQSFENFEFKQISMEVQSSRTKFLFIPFKYLTYLAEKNAIKYCDFALFLREDEGKAVLSFYKIQKPYGIFPLTLGPSNASRFDGESITDSSSELKVLFTGWFSAWFNREAANFLIEASKELCSLARMHGFSRLKITLAGRNARSITTKRPNNLVEIKFIESPNFEEMKKLFIESDLYISPVFSGEGMKTKILEALYYGLPVVTSSTSFRGYEPFLSNYVNDIIFVFDDRSVESLKLNFSKALALLKSCGKNEIRQRVVSIYNNVFDIRKFEETLSKVLMSLVK